MKAILIGLLIIIIGFSALYALVFIIGLITLFMRNTFTSSYSPYTYENIIDVSGSGILRLIIIGTVIIVAYLIGSAYLG